MTISINEQNELLDLNEQELDELFREAATPDYESVSGKCRGRVLAGAFFPLNTIAGIKTINTDLLPWKGKIFRPDNKATGTGFNRMEFGPFKKEMFKFESKMDTSIYDGKDIYLLDYDLQGNDAWLRPVRDEMKELREGLYLGRANYKISGEFKFAVYFTLEKLE